MTVTRPPSSANEEALSEASIKIDPKYARFEVGDLHLGRRLSFWATALTYGIKFTFVNQLKIYGREHIPPNKKLGSFIVAANHSTNDDPPMVGFALLPYAIAYMGKQELFTPAWPKGELYRMLGTFAVNRQKLEMATIRTAKTILQQTSWLLGIFPEGTRSQNGQVQEAKKGAAFLAQTCKVPILPIGIARTGPNGRIMTMQIGALISQTEVLDSSLEALTERLQQTIAHLKAQAEAKRS